MAKKKLKFWETNINPITGWVVSPRIQKSNKQKIKERKLKYDLKK